MDHKNMPVRCAPDSPDRCQANTAHGQCPFRVVPGVRIDRATNVSTQNKYCPIHGGKDTSEANDLYDIRLSEARHSIQKFRDHPGARTLSTELAMLRLLLEKIWNRCNDDLSILQNAASISKLVLEVSSLQHSNMRLEKQVGDLLDVHVVMQIAAALYGIVVRYIPDPDDREAIAKEFQDIVDRGINAQVMGEAMTVDAPPPRVIPTALSLDAPDDLLQVDGQIITPDGITPSGIDPEEYESDLEGHDLK